jgi:hypothetical protein
MRRENDIEFANVTFSNRTRNLVILVFQAELVLNKNKLPAIGIPTLLSSNI